MRKNGILVQIITSMYRCEERDIMGRALARDDHHFILSSIQFHCDCYAPNIKSLGCTGKRVIL